jgi:hypothetical protein
MYTPQMAVSLGMNEPHVPCSSLCVAAKPRDVADVSRNGGFNWYPLDPSGNMAGWEIQ